MPKPTTKAQFLQEIGREWEALAKVLAPLTPDQMCQPNIVGAWAVKDVLMHLVEWTHMVMAWYQAGVQGQTPVMPAPGYNWGQLPALNLKIYETYRDEPLPAVLQKFQTAHQHICAVIAATSEEALFTPGFYAWTKKLALLSYFNSGTSSHYRWARTEIKKGLKKATAQLG